MRVLRNKKKRKQGSMADAAGTNYPETEVGQWLDVVVMF